MKPKVQKPPKRNPIAKSLRDPKFKPKVIPNKKKDSYENSDTTDLCPCGGSFSCVCGFP